MTSISDGESGLSVRTKLNKIIDNRTFATRAAAVTEWAAMVSASYTPPVGTVWTFDGVSIEYDGSTTAVPGFSGWKPAGDVYAGHFGATGDGVTDDTAALAAFFAYGGDLHVAAGTYLVASTLSIPSDTRVTGAGIGKTIFKADAALDAPIFMSAATSAPYNNDISFRGFSIDGNRANQTPLAETTGIKLFSVENARFCDLYLYEIEGHGIHLNNSGLAVTGQFFDGVVIDGVGSSSTGTFGSCFAVTNGSDVTFDSCHALNSYKAGYRIGGAGYVFSSCVARGNGNGGIVPVSGCTDISVSGGIFADSIPQTTHLADGIRLVDCDRVTISGALIEGNASSGVAILNGSTFITVHGCTIRNNGKSPYSLQPNEKRSGIAVYGSATACSDVIIAGNIIDDNQGTATQDYGVEISDSSANVSICGNIFKTSKISSLALTTDQNTVAVDHANIGLALPTFETGSASVTGTLATTDLFTATVPADEIGRRGNFRVTCGGVFTGTAGIKTMSLGFGTGTWTLPATGLVAGDWVMTVDVHMTSTGGARALATLLVNGQSPIIDYNVITFTSTSDWDLDIRGKLGDTGDTISLDFVEIERLR